MNKRNFNKKKVTKEIEYVPQGSKQALDTLVESLELHPKTKELFAKNNIITVYDVAKRNAKQLFKIQGFGKKDLIGVERELAKLNVSLAPEENVVKQEDKPSEKVEKPVEPKKAEIKPKESKPQQNQKAKGEKVSQNEKADKKLPPEKNKKKQDKKQDKKPEKLTNEYKRISKGEKIGIGKGNETIIPPMYDEVFLPKEDMVCVDVDGLFGYVNMQNEMVIKPQYELAQSFSRGLANVMLNDVYGYIDKQGNTVIPFQFELATPFEEDDTARIKLEGRWGSIAKDGKITWI